MSNNSRYGSRNCLSPVAVFLALLLSACGQEPNVSPPQFVAAPELVASPSAPLAVVVSFVADRPVKARYRVTAKGVAWTHESAEYAKAHRQPLVNFAAGEAHEIAVGIVDEAGYEALANKPLVFAAAANNLPGFTPSPASLDGITLLSLFRYTDAKLQTGSQSVQPDPDYGLLLAVNENRDVVWSYFSDYPIARVEVESDAGLTLTGPYGRETIDYLGQSIANWRGNRQARLPGGGVKAKRLDASYLHSNSVVLPDGNRVLLSAEARLVDGYPAAAPNAESADVEGSLAKNPGAAGQQAQAALVVEDSILTMSPAGEIIKRWNLLDILDPQRQTYNSHLTTYAQIFPAFGGFAAAQTWSQANSLGYHPDTETLVVSLRHQEAVVGLNVATGQLKWLLGDPEGWRAPWAEKVLKPQKGGEAYTVPYSPSSLSITGNGELLLADNGGYRAVPPVRPGALKAANPRGVLVKVDEAAMTFAITASFELDQTLPLNDNQRWFRQRAISLTETPQGNVLVADGLPGRVYRFDRSGERRETVLALAQRAGGQRWGIADIQVIDKLVPPRGVGALDVAAYRQKPGQRKAISPDKAHTDRENPLTPDVYAPDASVQGAWRMTVGAGRDAYDRQLVLEQQGRLVTGSFGETPVVGWIKGNTFSVTVRNRTSHGHSRLRYRAVLSPDNEHMQGSLTLEIPGQPVTRAGWVANKL